MFGFSIRMHVLFLDKRTQETNNDSKENGERVSESEGATQPAAPPEGNYLQCR